MTKNCSIELWQYHGDWEKKIEAVKRLRNVLKMLPASNWTLRDSLDAINSLFGGGSPIIYEFTSPDPGLFAGWLHRAFEAEGFTVVIFYNERVTL